MCQILIFLPIVVIYLFIYLQCIPEKQLYSNTNCTLRAGIRIAFQDEIKQKEFK